MNDKYHSEQNVMRCHPDIHHLHARLLVWLTFLHGVHHDNHQLEAIDKFYCSKVGLIEMKRFEMTIVKTMFIDIDTDKTNKLLDSHRLLLIRLVKQKLEGFCNSATQRLAVLV